MSLLLRTLTTASTGAVFAGAIAFGSTAHAGLITEALEVIEAASLGSPSDETSDDGEAPELNVGETGQWPRFGNSNDIADLHQIGATGHGVGFGNSLLGGGVGGNPFSSRRGKGGSGGGGGGSGGSSGGTGLAPYGFSTEGVGPGPGIGDDLGFTEFALVGGNPGAGGAGGSGGTGGFGGAGGSGGFGGAAGGAGGAGGSGGNGGTGGQSTFDIIGQAGPPVGDQGNPGGSGGTGGGGSVDDDQVTIHNNPEPGSLTLLALGLASVAGWKWRKSRKPVS